MLLALEISTVLLVAITMGMALAHALELPGKLRLDEQTYLSVQRIYYPGFTIGGVAEPLALFAAFTLLFFHKDRTHFWLILTAFSGLLGMQIVFWSVTQTANRFWLRHDHLGTSGARFFALNRAKQGSEGKRSTPNWQSMRDQWEYSHVLRAVLSMISLVAIVIALAT